MLTAFALAIVILSQEPADHWPISKRVVREMVATGIGGSGDHANLAELLFDSGNTDLGWYVLDQLEEPFPGELFDWYRRDRNVEKALNTLQYLGVRIVKPLPSIIERALYRQDEQSIATAYRFVLREQRAGRDAGIGQDVVYIFEGNSPIARFCWLLRTCDAERESLEIAARELDDKEWRKFTYVVSTSKDPELTESLVQLVKIQPDRVTVRMLVGLARNLDDPELKRTAAEFLIAAPDPGEMVEQFGRIFEINMLMRDVGRNVDDQLAQKLVDRYWPQLEENAHDLTDWWIEWMAESGQHAALLNLANVSEQTAIQLFGQNDETKQNETGSALRTTVTLYRHAGRDDEAKALIEQIKSEDATLAVEMLDAFEKVDLEKAGPAARLEYAIRTTPDRFEFVLTSELWDARNEEDAELVTRLAERGLRELIRQKRPFRAAHEIWPASVDGLESLLRELAHVAYTADPANLDVYTARTYGCLFAFLGEDETALPYVLRTLDSRQVGQDLIESTWMAQTGRSIADFFSLGGTDVFGRAVQSWFEDGEKTDFEQEWSVASVCVKSLPSVEGDEERVEQLLGYLSSVLQASEPRRRQALRTSVLWHAIDGRDEHISVRMQNRVLDVIRETRRQQG